MRFFLTVLVATAAACGSHGGDDSSMQFTSIEVEPPFATVTVPLGGTATQNYVVYGITAKGKQDITTTCQLGIDPSFGTTSAATVTVVPHGGKTPVTAYCADLTGEAVLNINLVGSVVVPPAPANSADLFNNATAGTETARVPAIEYPIDGAVSPRNMPPIEVQWTAAQNDLFHVTLASTFTTIDIYTTNLESLLTETDWDNIIATSAGDNLAVTVAGLSQAAPAQKFTSTPTTIRIARDTIDRTAIYWWASSQGNIMSQTFGALSQPSLVKDDCTSCHSVSRAGTRIGYSRCVAGQCSQVFAGFLKYDGGTKTWIESVNANNKAIQGSYSTFAPVGNPFPTDAQAVAIVATLPGAKLSLYDPDSGAAIASNLETKSQLDPNAGGARSATMPDWSPDGTKVVFASTPHASQWIDISDSRIAMMSYQYTGGQHVFGDPTYLVPDPITLPSGTYNNFFFPSFSPDGALVVFNAARAQWRNFVDARTAGQRLMLADAAGAWVTDLTAMNGGNVDRDITWAHWAPTVGNDYYWIVFSSQRDYGHRVTEANSATACKANGVRQCKQLWIGAVAKNRLTGAVTMDPSAPPMWLPGQDTQADNISPYWSVPAGLQ